MKIIAINGSPRGKGGATWWVLEKFIRGIEDAGEKAITIHLAGKKIHHCNGDLSCWLKTPGKCVHDDDMVEIVDAVSDADRLILATPVYVDGMTGLMKNCLDRMIPVADPHFEMREGHMRHPTMGAGVKSVALVSVCGFYELDNFDPLVEHTRAICKNLGADFAGAVLRPAAPMLLAIPTIHPLFFKMRSLAKAIEKAGKEFVSDGRISDESMGAVSADVVSKEDYFTNGNKYFDEALEKIRK